MMVVVFPSLTLDLFKTIFKIAFFDIFDQFDYWKYFPFIKFNDSDVPFITQQMQNISFNDRNAATGLGSATIYLFLYFA